MRSAARPDTDASDPGGPRDDEEITVAATEEAEEEQPDALRYQISSYPSDMTLKLYHDKWRSNQLIIPEFQRQYVWDQTRASKLIESFLLGLPVPGVFLYRERSTNKLKVIDGQQRILSAVRFFDGVFDERVFRLKRVQSRWEGKSYADLSEVDRLQVEDTVLRATVVQQLDPADESSIYHVFERLNTGGVRLSPMEIRKCVYSGAYLTWLETLNRGAAWRDIVGSRKPDRRLRDVELILRVLALCDGWSRYEKPMKSFLNEFIVSRSRPASGQGRVGSQEELAAHGARFEAACATVLKALGPRPFHLRGPLNLGLLDSVLSAVLNAERLSARSLKARFDGLLQDRQFLEDVSRNTSDTLVVKRRFERAQQALVVTA